MPDHSSRTSAHRLGRSGDRRTVLLTGASGVVGQGLLPRLHDVDVVCLVHKTPVQYHGVTSVPGDLMQPRMGLSDLAYRALAGRVDAVIHCGAVTQFGRADDALQATNVEGTGQVLDFVERAGATLLHVSTAFIHAEADGGHGHTAVTYAESKRAGEDLVRASGLRHVILRPSIVLGDSVTGEISAFQGLYMVAGALLSGLIPLIPFDPAWTIDFVPNDVVADAIATVLEADLTSGELWITAGDQALRLDEAVTLCADLAAEWGFDVDIPRFVPPEMFDRLIAPVFLEALPRRVRLTVLRLLEFFAAYLASDGPMPSSQAELTRLGAASLPDPRDTLLTSIGYWATATGRIPAQPATQVA